MTMDKNPCAVVLYTRTHRIEGNLILLKGEQLSDKLNVTDRKFEAIENARVYTLDGGQLVHEAPFVAVNKDHVTLLTPRGA